MHEPSLIDLTVGRKKLLLHTSPTAFVPNTTTTLLFEAALPVAGLRVLDMGCGIGPVAIAAALYGAETVIAADVMPEACALTSRNVRLNQVEDRVDVLCGHALSELGRDRFDVIISDVSGMADETARLSPWYPESIPTGGLGGADLATEVIDTAKDHLKPGGRLVFPILGLSQAPLIEARARRVFGDSLTRLLEKDIPFHRSLYQHMETLTAQKKAGLIDYTKRGSRLCWKLELFQAQV